MKNLLLITIFLYSWLLLSTPLAAQEDYKKYMSLSYAEIDSMMMLHYKKAAYIEAIPYLMAGREKAKVEFGQDSAFALYTADLGFMYYKMGQYQKTEPLYLQALAIRKDVLGTTHAGYAMSLNNLAGLYEATGLFNKAEKLYIEALSVREKTLGKEDADYGQSLSNLAFLYRKTGDYQRAESMFIEAQKVYEKASGTENLEYSISLNNLASLYQAMGNYALAEPLYLQVIAIRKKVLGEEHPNYAIALNNLATLYNAMENYGKAEPLFLQSMNIRKKILGEEHPSYAKILNNIAELHQHRGKYDAAEELLLQSLKIRKKALGEEHWEYAANLNNLGGLYKKMGEYNKAEKFYRQCIEIEKKVFGEENPECAESLNNIAELYLAWGKLDSAFAFCKKGMAANSTEGEESFADWTKIHHFNYYSNEKIINSLISMQKILRAMYLKSNKNDIAEAGYALAEAGIKLCEHIRNGFGAEADKLRILEKSNLFMQQGIAFGILLKKNPKEIFNFAEANKGILVLENSKATDAYQLGNLPDSLAQQEKNLQKKQSELQAKILEKHSTPVKDSLNALLATLNQEIEAFNKTLKNNYPQYISFKYGQKNADVTAVQATLDNKTALLEYLLADSLIYIFYIDKNKVNLFQKNIQKDSFALQIRTLHDALSDYDALRNNADLAFTQYSNSAYWFYLQLVAPVLSDAAKVENLIIIPDGEIAHLPFEAFLYEDVKHSTNYKDLPYLLRKYNISYNYSATIWKGNRESKANKNNSRMIAIAPTYSGGVDSIRTALRLPTYTRLRKVLTDLPAARAEVETLEKKYTGLFAFDSLATENLFKSKASEYRIIHLAMHGLLDKKSPTLSSLAFTEDGDSVENNFLQAYEISKMQLNADLVVLSACETGFGKFETGNGTASLARAFMYAGVPAMVVSLWQVNDASTSTIMQLFYKNLAKGMDKAAALRQAKLDYVKAVDNPNAAHPAFWAAFVLIGDERPIAIATKGSGMMWYLIGGVGLLALIGSIFVLRRKEK